ncbi:helix-turn-helix domain-containing protein [Piscinibacter gummiphilus]|uniref:helix-turn-helix domain-containing protein n=1 Tax=Piscinibacter gummiphilus TaxID=946333 RepID=UPI000A26B696|nr:helix-turn-helix transcriptional regulator [Piscinibacter gummiphilus]ATU67135.1 XRE family transcriptional regulator [Piscinibacter gummiphilus]GLS98020.1 hypothetical protein GCM10007918_53120 [Piscinibacter gummiphilus]
MGDFESNLVVLGRRLKAMRQERGLRLVDVAAMAGLPRLKVIHVESGRPGVAASSYARVAAALGGQLQVIPAQRPTLEEIAELLG